MNLFAHFSGDILNCRQDSDLLQTVCPAPLWYLHFWKHWPSSELPKQPEMGPQNRKKPSKTTGTALKKQVQVSNRVVLVGT